MLKLPKSILMDLDDTILANEVLRDSCMQSLWREFSAELDEESFRRFDESFHAESDRFWSNPERHRIWRVKLEDARRMIFTAAMESAGAGDEALASRMAVRYSDIREDSMHIIPGAVEAIEAFRAGGVSLALITNGGSGPQRKKIERFGLSPLFDHIFIEGEQGYGKPDSRIYFTALQALHSRPEEAWMIGDNLSWDVIPPQKLGMKGIWVRNGRGRADGLPGEKPFLIIDALGDMLDLL